MERIQFFDTTLRDGEQTIGVNFSIEDKINIAKQLVEWGVDVIEAGFPVASKNDFMSVRKIGQEITGCKVTGLARCVRKDIDAVIEALGDTPNGQIHVFIATSPIHREAKLHMTREEVIKTIQDCVSYAHREFEHVEFSPEDATRTEWDFLVKAIRTAIFAGADVINIPDTTGYTNPEEIGELFDYLKDNIPEFDEVTFSVHCHNDLGMATANALAAIRHGATRVEGTINGIGERAGNTALEEVAATLMVRKDFYQVKTNVCLDKTFETAKMVSQKSKMQIPNNKPITGTNAFSHESGIHQDGFLKYHATYEILTPQSVGVAHSSIPLGKLSGSHAVIVKLEELGYEIDKDITKDIFAKFKSIADNQAIVSDKDLVQMMDEIQVVSNKK
ncbi:2-isopropylmalate synthase [Liquorilactobacillus mali]|uniref:2-isopropylmalate synthase n=1 Tax=Liquorilactobacillus mali KCTC 3596 = DSM 20444 TaxID=1046596 RepID=J1F4L7_9LACO|nr:2-isopropylmalate synthase [Liquorilactobacillus mali]EJF00882.1 2-isopropylmalate synthase [Liquorilactobacillus mali KCTC 3596 = DSM 20444]KRN11491.1 2-isopropylmalate synthase [Liquorilactobacillus mali KCTC 3596 = DSM 20444]QFQ74240.1 2-isopropylmalate synthase [Liquorilactobacillus mali]